MFSLLIGSKALHTGFQRVEQIQEVVLYGLSTAWWIWKSIGMCISVFALVFRSLLFLVGRQPIQASRFVLITRGVARISGLLAWFRGSVEG